MAKPYTKLTLIFVSAVLLFACNTQKQIGIDVKLTVTLDGKPAADAQVTVDGTPAGATDNQGKFESRLQRLPGQEVTLAVKSKTPGYRIEPWHQSFITKLPKAGAIESYPFDVRLKGEKYFTLAVVTDDEPLEAAAVLIQKQKVGQSDANGDYIHSYKKMPKKGFFLSVRKKGYHTWKRRVKVKPGERYEVALKKKATKVAAPAPADVEEAPASIPAAPAKKRKSQAKTSRPVWTIVAQTDAYGVAKALPGVVVSINGNRVGKTDARGKFGYRFKRPSTKGAKLQLSAPGHIPAQWETTVPIKGRRTIQRYFYPAKPAPIEVGLYGYINNSPEADLSAVLDDVEAAVRSNLFLYRSFKEVPKSQLREMMLMQSLDMETVSTKGWQHTGLIKSVDMIVAGSVTQDERGFTIETSLITADGKILLSQINKARKQRDIKRTAKLIVAGIIDQFPFEGAVAAIEDDGYRINLGTHNYKIRRGNQFRYMAAQMDRSGRIKGYREQGLLRVVKTSESASWTEVASLNENQQIKVGDKVVRRIYLEEEREAAKASFVLMATGGTEAQSGPLWGVNVYLNNTWVGTTRANGKVEVPAHLNEAYDLLLSRHGYQPVHTTVEVTESKSLKTYSLAVANALFKVESMPSSAEVFVDGVKIGQTPLLDGELVNFGFRKVRLSVGGEFRDWEQVVEFNKPEVAFTGSQKIALMKDYYKIGQQAEQNGNLDGAIKAYASIERQNPDYSNARHRLAQLYMDEKKDYNAAIVEFEKVLALPENKQIIFNALSS